MSSPSKLPFDDPPRRRKILCIDDQPDGLAIRKLFLETFGFDVVLARSGVEGLRILNETSLDGVLLDYRMPGMDGAAVAAEIRRLRPELPVVMLSGYVAEIPKNIHNLVNAFVSKGSPPAELIATLEKALGPGLVASVNRFPATHILHICISYEMAIYRKQSTCSARIQFEQRESREPKGSTP